MLLEAALLVALLLYLYLRSIRVKVDPRIPYPKPCYPVLGHVPHVIQKGKNINEALQEFQLKWSSYFKEGLFIQYVGPKPLLCVYNTQIVEAVLKDSTITDKPFEYSFIKPWLGDGLITSSGEIWKKHRKLLNPAFHSQVLVRFLPTINAEAEQLVQTLKTLEGSTEVDIRPYLSNVALRIITATAMALPVDALSEKYNEYLESVRLVLEIFFHRVHSPHLWTDFIFYLLPLGWKYARVVKYLHSFTSNAIKARMSERAKELKTEYEKRKTFLDLILDHEKGRLLTDREIREEVDTVMFAGHDTSAVTLMWAILLIGRHPETQEKISEELKFIFGDEKDPVVTLENINQMNYLECVIKEVLRLYPAVPIIGRKIHKDIELPNYTLPANCTVLVLLFVLHRNPKAFESPNEFMPERFENVPSDSLASRSFAPFALGARNCIGQRFAMLEMKVILARIFLSYHVEVLDQVESVQKSVETVLTPISPIRVTLKSR